jgi:hypothetical protein
LRGYYSVFNPRGEKIADCGMERDAVNLMHMRNARWDGHYFTFIPLPGDIINITQQNQLPTKDIVVNQEVEYIEIGGQKLPIQQQLNQNNSQPFNF